ncbi:MAG: CHAD domain-containing protein [Magnetococcales bacterium]|nr:CHAD domain-containing protein [Magnetococcales bacterium]
MNEMTARLDHKGDLVGLHRHHSVSDAFGLILEQELLQLQTWIPVAHANSDPEGVHQVRVSLRRMRSAMAIFGKVLPREEISPWADTTRWLASSLGPARDLDVFMNESILPVVGRTPYLQGESVVMELARQRRLEMQHQLQQTLDSPRCQEFMGRFGPWLVARSWFQKDIPARNRLKLTRSIVDFARQSLDKRYLQTQRHGQDITTLSDPELHELRIECKKLRYVADFFSSLFSENRMHLFIRNLKSMQNILGLMNDVAVLPALLDNLLQGVTDVEALRFSSAILGWRSKGYEDARRYLETRWSEFSNTPLPWLNSR